MRELQKINKPFNFRLPAAFALSLAAGIAFGTALAYYSADGVYILIPSVFMLTVLTAVIIYFRRVDYAVLCAIVIVAFLIGALYVYFYCASFGEAEVSLDVAYKVTGRVSEVGVTGGGRNYIIVSGAEANGVRLGGKIIAYLNSNAGDYCEGGYLVTFTAKLNQQGLFDDGSVTFNAQRAVKYYCTINSGLEAQHRFSLFGWVNGAIRSRLFDNLDTETASVCYALLTGNSSLISEGTLASFRNGGIAHLFAVSGLHIGVIFAAMTFILNKLPVNRYVSAAVRIVVVLLYSGVCAFSASSVRAAITCSFVVLASLTHKKFDPLNAMSTVAVILLLINPLYLYGAGFLLSFGASLGIILLKRNLSKVFYFLPAKVRDVLAMSLSAQLAIIPTQLSCFGYISLAGLILNVLIIPVASVLYLLLFASAMFALIVPIAAVWIIPFAATPVQLLINLAVEFGFENAILVREVGNWIYLPFALLMAGITDKLNVRLFLRGVFVSVGAIWLCLAFVTGNDVSAYYRLMYECGKIRQGVIKCSSHS